MSQKIINTKPGSLLDLLIELFNKGMRIANIPATNTNTSLELIKGNFKKLSLNEKKKILDYNESKWQTAFLSFNVSMPSNSTFNNCFSIGHSFKCFFPSRLTNRPFSINITNL